MKIFFYGLLMSVSIASPALADTLWWGCHRGGNDMPDCGKQVCDIGMNMSFRIERAASGLVVEIYQYRGDFGPYSLPDRRRVLGASPSIAPIVESNVHYYRMDDGVDGERAFDFDRNTFTITIHDNHGVVKKREFACHSITPVE